MMDGNPDPHSRLSLSSLLCQETCTETRLHDHKQEEDEGGSHYPESFDTDQDEYVRALLDREINICEVQKRQSSHTVISTLSAWFQSARSDAITWIIKTRALFGFQFQTAYLSITYFDRFVSRRAIEEEKKDWAIKLLSVSCLSLAAKMEESKIPALLEFPVKYSFENKVIQRMELLVLDTLEWRMYSVTPIDYVQYFISKFCQNNQAPSEIVSKTLQIILATFSDVNLVDYRPSVIAVAAIFVALDQRLTKRALESKINALSLNGFINVDDIFSCCTQMQELEPAEIELQIGSPELSPTQLKRNSSYEFSSPRSAGRNKRKRLAFNENDPQPQHRA